MYDDWEQLSTDMEHDAIFAGITCNVFLHKHPDFILKPNMHISRCTPLHERSYQNNASSLDETTWILQQMGCMMPITSGMAKTLLTKSPGNHEETLTKAYRTFLQDTRKEEEEEEGSDSTDSELFNTFLMHWFMSEFHPSKAIREVAVVRLRSR